MNGFKKEGMKNNMSDIRKALNDIVINNEKAIAACLAYKDNRHVIEYKFSNSLIITVDIFEFGYSSLIDFTNLQTWFYDDRNSFIIEKMKLVSENKFDFSDLPVYHDRSIIFLIEDGIDGKCGSHPNMRIWCGPEKKEYLLFGDTPDNYKDMEQVYSKIIKENMYDIYKNIIPGNVYFIDRRIKPEYGEVF